MHIEQDSRISSDSVHRIMDIIFIVVYLGRIFVENRAFFTNTSWNREH